MCKKAIVLLVPLLLSMPQYAKNIKAEFDLSIYPSDTSITVTNKSKNATEIVWYFGDSISYTVNNLDNITHKYLSYGTYNVCLTAKGIINNSPETDSTCKTFQLAPAENFEANFDIQINNLSITIANKSAGKISKTLWDFGDGTTSSKANETSHTYTKTGTYTITLSISNKKTKQFSSASRTIMILGNFSQGIAYFETDPIAGKAVQFKNLSFGNNLKSFWNFGDGITSTQTNPLHNYKNAGIYQVQLTTIDELNNVSNYETSIIVASAEALFNSKFQAYPDLESDTVVFINKTTTNGNGKYLWSFGDGYVSEEYSPEHVYSQKGNYNVCLSVFDNSKSADIKCQTINVGSNSTVVSSFNAIVENLKVSFVNTTHGENSYYWNFGDSITSTGINPIHQYSTAGIYTVVLKANNGSLNNSAVSVINLSNNPEQLVCRFVNEKVSNTLKATGTQVKFKGVISGDISRLRINWNFGDGETDSTTTEPTHTYSEPDLYTVCYTVTNPDNDETYQYCEDLNLKSEVNLTHNQISLFDFAPNPAKNKLSVNITNNNLPSTISISTLFGQIVKQLNISANSILPINCDLSLSPGFYIVKLQQGNNSNCKKLVVK